MSLVSSPPPAVAAERRTIRVSGIVQGVGFRPFVWTLASRLGLSGAVRNTSGAVLIEAEGPPQVLEDFLYALRQEAPPLARIGTIEVAATRPVGDEGFRIETSQAVVGEYQPIAADAATCGDCLRELFDPDDRRHRYPFINCTNCGPRFTIIEDIPYDRALTTMREFRMCARCQAEYDDPSDRRFHAQPNACAACGPRVWLATAAGTEVQGDAVALAAAALDRGEIVAVKGLGGFHLACDARNPGAVSRLRRRKHRPSKPFAVMVRDLDAARRLCAVPDAAAALLESPARPVVLVPRLGAVAAEVAPGLDELGILLPSTPLHHLLLRATAGPLVMTSGNLTEEPIARRNQEAVDRLGGIADWLLLHDREIHARYDDSVVRLIAGEARTIRRARGMSPLPIEVEVEAPTVLALGAHLKNTFTLLRDGRALVGQHIGDLDNPPALRSHAEALATYLRLFRAEPEVVACDEHPDYASTALAEAWWDRGARPVRVQHHHAHIASVMAEHGLRGDILGVAFDGAGLGPDSTVWGGEFLLCDERRSRRVGNLAPVALPGSDRCAREGWRMLAACLVAAGAREAAAPPAGGGIDERQWRLVSRVASAATTTRTSSAGRLFDAVASLLGAGHTSSFEAEAAMRLEAMARTHGISGTRPLAVTAGGDPLVLDTPALVAALLAQLRRGRPAAELAAVFHETLAHAVAQCCVLLGTRHRLRRVALSGGVFQNQLLLERSIGLLRDRGFLVYTNSAVPANDGGVSLGQALVAASLSGSRAAW